VAPRTSRQRPSAEYLNISPGPVDHAIGYYTGHLDEIDEWISNNAAMVEEAEAAWRTGDCVGGSRPTKPHCL